MEERILARIEKEECGKGGGVSGSAFALLIGVIVLVASQKMSGSLYQWRTR